MGLLRVSSIFWILAIGSPFVSRAVPTDRKGEVSVNGLEWGLALVVVAACANAAFALPMKFVRRWEWENTWLAWSLFALVLLPLATALISIPTPVAVYRQVGAATVAWVLGCGFGWGCAQVLFGLAMDSIGVGLAFSIVLGVSAAVGSLVPLLRISAMGNRAPLFWSMLPSIGLVILGVLVCAIAGSLREKAQGNRVERKRSFALGFSMALGSGVCAAFMNVGVALGAPLAHSAAAHGAATQNSVNAIWLPLLAAGAVPNLGYCLFLFLQRGTWSKFRSSDTPFNLSLAGVMAILWFFSTALYGSATRLLGDLGTVVGWPAFMSLIVIIASVLGMAIGEWKRSGQRPVRLQLAGMCILVLAVIALSRAQIANTPPPSKSSQTAITAGASVGKAEIGGEHLR